MTIRLAILTGLVLSASEVYAQPQESTPIAPVFSVVRSVKPKEGYAVLTRDVLYIERVPVVERVNLNGKIITRTVHVDRQAVRQVDIYYYFGDSRVITTDGKQLPIDEIWKRLKPDLVIAISGDFKQPAEVYLRALNAETLVLIPSDPRKSKPK